MSSRRRKKLERKNKSNEKSVQICAINTDGLSRQERRKQERDKNKCKNKIATSSISKGFSSKERKKFEKLINGRNKRDKKMINDKLRKMGLGDVDVDALLDKDDFMNIADRVAGQYKSGKLKVPI